MTPAARQAVTSGLTWLAGQQLEDGSFGSTSHYGKHVAITGLAGLAFMADGHVPGRGEYGLVVHRCVDFILSSRSESGLLAFDTSHGPMYGHGFATLFLAEVYGMSPQPELREALRKAIRLIVTTQNDEGGWRYQPVRADADLSVTVCQVMALRAARNAGRRRVCTAQPESRRRVSVHAQFRRLGVRPLRGRAERLAVRRHLPRAGV
jgi:hypothetical protein